MAVTICCMVGSACCANGNGFVNGNKTPHRTDNPQLITEKFAKGDHVGNWYEYARSRKIHPGGGTSVGMGDIY